MVHLMGNRRCPRQTLFFGPSATWITHKNLPEQSGENQAYQPIERCEKFLEFRIDMAESRSASAEVWNRRNFFVVFSITSMTVDDLAEGRSRCHHLESSGERSRDATTQERSGKRGKRATRGS